MSGERTWSISWPIPGMIVATPAEPGFHLEDLDQQRVARLGTANRDWPGCPVDAVEVDVGDEVVLGLDLAGEAVVRLERDDGTRLDLEHRLQRGAEAPDDVVARNEMIDADTCQDSPPTGEPSKPRVRAATLPRAGSPPS